MTRDSPRILLRRSVAEVLVTQVCNGKTFLDKYQYQYHNVEQNNEEQQLPLDSRNSSVQAQYEKHASAAPVFEMCNCQKSSGGTKGGHWPGLGLGL